MVPMSKWPKQERPRERLREVGPVALSDSEILAILIGTGSGQENVVEVARRLLSDSDGLEGLTKQGLKGLGRFSGMGEAKASRIVAALELGIRVVERRGRKKSPLRFECSADIFESFRTRLGLKRQEVFVAVGLNSRNEAIREILVARGSSNECLVEPKEVFRPMIAEAASKTILLHNHPSGDPTPSPQDVALTRRLAKVGDLVGIPVLDHVVIGPSSYSSLRDLGLLADV